MLRQWHIWALIVTAGSLSGCRVVVPSVRTHPDAGPACGCSGAHAGPHEFTDGTGVPRPGLPGLAGLPLPAFFAPAESGPAPAPHSKFHPVPTRPVFYPDLPLPTLSEVPHPTPAERSSQDYPLPPPRPAPQELLPLHEGNAQPLPKVPVDDAGPTPPAPGKAPNAESTSDPDLRLTSPLAPARRASASLRLLPANEADYE
jgi:hypothetical protein